MTWVFFYLGIKVPGNVGGKRDYVAESLHSDYFLLFISYEMAFLLINSVI